MALKTLTEKQKAFCREYFTNGGNGTQAYLAAYDSNSPVSAAIEANRLLDKTEIQDYINSLNRPLENKARSEREKKRAVLWSIIENGDNNDKCRAMDILNKMDSEYININRNITEDKTNITNLDSETLKRLSDGL